MKTSEKCICYELPSCYEKNNKYLYSYFINVQFILVLSHSLDIVKVPLTLIG